MDTSAGDTIVLSSKLKSREAALRGGRVEVDDAAQLRALVDTSGALRAAGVPHALIGGIAVGVRSGVARATVGVDLAVHSTAEVEVLIATMRAAGFEHRGTFAHSINFRSDSGEPVQLAFDPAFDLPIRRASTVSVAAHAIPVVGTDDLIEMKERAAASPRRRASKALRDRADIALLRGDIPDEDEGW